MYKCNMELARINRYMKLKFNLVLIDDKEGVGGNKNATKVIDVFKLKGNDYLRLNPKPYITIDISGGSDKSDGYNANTLVNLTSVSLFNLMALSIPRPKFPYPQIPILIIIITHFY